jgi:hypothetical protein
MSPRKNIAGIQHGSEVRGFAAIGLAGPRGGAPAPPPMLLGGGGGGNQRLHLVSDEGGSFVSLALLSWMYRQPEEPVEEAGGWQPTSC